MFDTIKSDFTRYFDKDNPGIKNLLYLMFTQGLWAITVYRFGIWSNKIRIPLLGQFIRLIYFFLFKAIEIITGISISVNARIGRGLYIGHFGQIFISNEVEMGEHCSLGQGVTIGMAGLGKKGAPKIGNNVYIGAGAKILGKIVLGDNVHVGANAVVVKDAPDNATVVGVPGKIIKINKD